MAKYIFVATKRYAEEYVVEAGSEEEARGLVYTGIAQPLEDSRRLLDIELDVDSIEEEEEEGE
jgi:hypothetical protein